MTMFFGAGAGRCGTMTLANLINAEEGIAALHEGKFRHRETPGDQWLPFLTLQNLRTYHDPETAISTLESMRSAQVAEIIKTHNLKALGDIAYNYAPFVAAIPRVFPDAKLIYIHRDGRDFVRSVLTDEVPDPTPVGWLDRKPSDKVERYISLGRLRPRPTDPLNKTWSELSAISKNAWLWSETNRLILDGLEDWNPDNLLTLRFSEFFSNLETKYNVVREFLGITKAKPPQLEELMCRPINSRRRRMLPAKEEWTDQMNSDFFTYAEATMNRLGYAADGFTQESPTRATSQTPRAA